MAMTEQGLVISITDSEKRELDLWLEKNADDQILNELWAGAERMNDHFTKLMKLAANLDK